MTVNLLTALPILAALGYAAWTRVERPAAVSLADRFRLGVGDAMPDLALVDTAGNAVRLHALVGSGPALLLVVDPDCGHCHTELRTLRTVRDRLPESSSRVVLVVVGEAARAARLGREHSGLDFYAEPARTLKLRYGLPGVPLSLELREGARIERVVLGAQGETELRRLLQRMAPSST